MLGRMMNDGFDDRDRRKLFSSGVGSTDFRPASALVRADFAARSHHGRAFQHNDDHYLVVRFGRHEETLFTSLPSRDVVPRFDEYGYASVVSDGIGRDGAGAVAARLAISTLAALALRFGQWQMRVDPDTASEIMERSRWYFQLTHEAVMRWSRAHLEAGRMGAAMTATYSAGNDLFVAHVGHSRCYLFRDGLLTQLTRDQTLRERLASAPQPVPVGRLDDLQHILTHSIGADASEPGVTVEQFRLKDDDCLLLCSNGLTDMVSNDDIANVLASRRALHEQCELLVDSALLNGGSDNVTVVLANYHIPDGQSESDDPPAS
jgi:PPM family protein phosphatase